MRPIVLVPSDVKPVGLHPFHCVGEKYLSAVSHGSDVQALIVPAIGAGQDLESLESKTDIDGLLDLADGILLTGSLSNVDPQRYGQAGKTDDSKFDRQRDSTVFCLLNRAVDRQIPLLAICRGIQELNVACGGSLHAALHETQGFNDHREDDQGSREQMYAPAHDVVIKKGGRLSQILADETIRVNSLHGQGIATLGEGLRVEAVSPDGVIEAVSLDSHFVLGVQWHPEWQHQDNPESRAIFQAFGDAVREYARAK